VGDYINLFTKDISLLTLLEDEGETIEPLHFLPIIPVQLLYRTNSPGFGFSYRAMSYSIDDIIDNCLYQLLEGDCTDPNNPYPLRPDIDGINPNNFVFNSSKSSWYNIGEYELNFDKDTLIIKDLPYNVQLQQYEEYLDDLKEQNVIGAWVNYSQENYIQYGIKFYSGGLRKLYYGNKWKFYNTFKLVAKIPEDELNCIDVNGNILFFKTPYHLIQRFVGDRLIYYEKRRQSEIKKLETYIHDIKNRIRFLELVNSGELVVANKPIDNIRAQMDIFNLPHNLLALGIEKLSETEITKSNDKLKSFNDELKYYQDITSKELYISDLIELKQQVSTISIVNNE
jgi:DNA topoisomerase-2